MPEKIFQNIIIIIIIIGLSCQSEANSFKKSDEQRAGNNQNVFNAGDGIKISTQDTTSFLNKVFPIKENGMVEFPILGDVYLLNKTESEIENFIKENFKEYLRFPEVNVKPLIRISVLGGFQRTGLFYVDENQTLWEVIRMTGGPVMEDGLKDMILERDRDEVIEDLIPYLQSGSSLVNMGIKSGDQIWTPSPAAESTWDIVRQNVLPLATFAFTIYTFYLNFQMVQSGYRSSSGL